MKSLLNISDLKKEEITEILNFADELKSDDTKPLKNMNIGMIFEKYSTRTRLSFHTAINNLGGEPIKIDFDEMNIKRIESFEDTFEILSCYLDMIVYRTDSHKKLVTALKYFNKPIINALSDYSHPCQAISDIYTLKEHFGFLENISISWFGDMNNVLYSLCEIIDIIGNIKLNIFTDNLIYQEKKNIFNFENINIFYDINEEVISNTDCFMTDVYTSMNDRDNSKEEKLKKFQVNSNLINLGKKDAIFMHCLPANINLEVTGDVIKSKKSIVKKQALNRYVAQKGILKWLSI